ncbi:MAG: signal recognition particle subunit SRP19/SEC65 family protein [Methanoregula sp.]|jgi:signal recognition particle subunit SRP19|uniref:signal recognition particle subunit SRP19/SEC65 family protein n=1 Tax=Methanoregula sp. TaxID=2052170 RepID=UPI003D101216
MTKGEYTLYPCYFNAAYSRGEGRRVPRSLGVKGPVLTDLERALRRAGVNFRVDDHHHPAHWARREGRIIAEWGESKERLIRKVAQKMEVRK